jgi:hypothetical protein
MGTGDGCNVPSDRVVVDVSECGRTLGDLGDPRDRSAAPKLGDIWYVDLAESPM